MTEDKPQDEVDTKTDVGPNMPQVPIKPNIPIVKPKPEVQTVENDFGLGEIMATLDQLHSGDDKKG